MIENELAKITVKIEDLSAEGMGVAKVDGRVIFVKKAAPGDEVSLTAIKKKRKYFEAAINEVVKPSADRILPQCAHFGLCGGCKWQHIRYEKQIAIKEKIVFDAMERIGKVTIEKTLPIMGCEEVFNYRNKLEFAFTDRKWLTNEEISSGNEFDRRGVGFHVPDSFSGVVDISHCWLQDNFSNLLRNFVREYAIAENLAFFDLKNQKGMLRNLMVRTTSIGEILVLFSFGENNEDAIGALLGVVLNEFPQITSLQYVINPKRNDTIYDLYPIVYHGTAQIKEKLGKYYFFIGPKSFFQTNSRQANRLYEIAKDFAQIAPNDTVYDLYTGVGSIAIYLSDSCQKVIGIEQIEEAIADAKNNATLNQINNAVFYAGDVRMVLNPDFIAKNGKPDVVITDPPRAGMHQDVVETLLALAAPKIVYVSCNPGTQARDLQLLSSKYRIEKSQAVDMFPQTTHIENVVLLKLI